MPKKTLTILCVSLASLVLLSLTMKAQVNATGSIAGYITDDRREPLPGATITVTSPTMLGMRTAIADLTGYYRLPALPPGKHKIVVELDQFNRQIQENVEVNVAAILRIDFKLVPKTVTEKEIVVTANAPVVETEKTTVDTVITNSILTSLPILGRDFMQSIKILPGVTESDYGTSISGARDTDKNYNIDGSDNIDLVQGMVLGGGGYSLRNDKSFITFDQEAIQELSVGRGAFSADVGFGSGGLINVVTKSGSNAYHGSLYTYIRNDSWDKSAPYPFETYQFGGSFGGPIVKDKLMFFMSLAPQIENRGYDPRTRLQQNIPDTLIQRNRSFSAFGKLTWLTGRSNTLNLSLNIPTSVFHTYCTLWHVAPDFPPFDRTYGGWSATLTDTAMLGSNFLLETVASAGRNKSDVINRSGQPMGLTLDLETYTATGTNPADFQFRIGKVNWSERMTWFVDNWGGRHTVGSGLELRYNQSRQAGVSSVFSYIYPAFYQEYGLPHYSTSLTPAYELKFQQTYLAWYLTDAWAPSKRFVIKPGVRISRNSYMPKVLVEPRFDFSIVPFNDTKTVIRGGANLYYERLNEYAQQLANYPPQITVYTWWDDTTTEYPESYRYYEIDPNLKYPRTEELTIGVEREIIKDISLSVDFVYRNYKDQLFTRYINLLDPVTGQPDDPTKGAISYYSNFGNSKYKGLFVVLQKRFSHGNQFLISYAYQFSRGNSNLFLDFSQLQMIFTSYYLLKGDPQLADMYGRTAYDKPYELKAFGSLNLPLGFTVSGVFNWTAGTPYTTWNSQTGKMASDYQSLRSPYLMNLDMRLEKYFRIKSFTLRAMLEAYNLTNRENVTEIWADVSDPDFGIPYNIGPSRRVQVGLRMEW